MSLLKLSGMRQMVQEALNLPVDLVTMAGIEAGLRKEIAGTEILLYEAQRCYCLQKDVGLLQAVR